MAQAKARRETKTTRGHKRKRGRKPAKNVGRVAIKPSKVDPVIWDGSPRSKQTIADFLSFKMGQKGWTQADVAEQAECSQHTISCFLRCEYAGWLTTTKQNILKALGLEVVVQEKS